LKKGTSLEYRSAKKSEASHSPSKIVRDPTNSSHFVSLVSPRDKKNSNTTCKQLLFNDKNETMMKAITSSSTYIKAALSLKIVERFCLNNHRSQQNAILYCNMTMLFTSRRPFFQTTAASVATTGRVVELPSSNANIMTTTGVVSSTFHHYYQQANYNYTNNNSNGGNNASFLTAAAAATGAASLVFGLCLSSPHNQTNTTDCCGIVGVVGTGNYDAR
jgi:hypothetical protein